MSKKMKKKAKHEESRFPHIFKRTGDALRRNGMFIMADMTATAKPSEFWRVYSLKTGKQIACYFVTDRVLVFYDNPERIRCREWQQAVEFLVSAEVFNR